MPSKRKKASGGDLNNYSSNLDMEKFSNEENTNEPKKKNFPYFFVLIVLIILGYLLFKNKDLVLSGTVNNQPIFVWELNSRMNQRYGKQVLDEIISERLVVAEANRQNIKVSPGEIDKKVSEVEKTFGGKTGFEQALKQQGLSLSDFKKQIELRLTVEKILSDKIKVTSKEVEDFLTQNKDNIESFAGSESAKQKQYAEDSLKQQKMSAEFEKWFSALKSKAQISNFLQ